MECFTNRSILIYFRQSSTTKEPQESLSAIYGVKGADETTADSLAQRLGERKLEDNNVIAYCTAYVLIST